MYCLHASSARCPVSGFFSSAVTTGRPLTLSTTSMMHLRGVPSGFLSTLDVKLTCRVIVSRLAAYRAALSGFMLEFG